MHRVLTPKFHVPPDLWRQLDAKPHKFEQAPPAAVSLDIPIPDPDDILILACAIAAKADAFVTGDKALLDLGKVEGMPILSPRQLWQKLV